jgi:hypothetical protein
VVRKEELKEEEVVEEGGGWRRRRLKKEEEVEEGRGGWRRKRRLKEIGSKWYAWSERRVKKWTMKSRLRKMKFTTSKWQQRVS